MKLVKVEPAHKIVVLKPVNNPTRRGTARFKRVDAVLRARTVGDAVKRGALLSTIRYCHSRNLVRIVR